MNVPRLSALGTCRLVLISVGACVDLRAIVQPEGLCQWKIQVTPPVIETATFRPPRASSSTNSIFKHHIPQYLPVKTIRPNLSNQIPDVLAKYGTVGLPETFCLSRAIDRLTRRWIHCCLQRLTDLAHAHFFFQGIIFVKIHTSVFSTYCLSPPPPPPPPVTYIGFCEATAALRKKPCSRLDSYLYVIWNVSLNVRDSSCWNK